MRSQDDHNKKKGPRRRVGRTVVRLNTAALWERLTLLNRSQNWLAREVGVSPGYISMLVNAGRTPSVAFAAGCSGPWVSTTSTNFSLWRIEMTNHNDSSRFDGITEQVFDEEQDLALQAAVLAEDFPKRLERLHEVSGLTWAAFARAIGVDPKLVHRWRNGVEPRGWAMHALFRFAARMPGGMAILVTESFQMSFFKEHS